MPAVQKQKEECQEFVSLDLEHLRSTRHEQECADPTCEVLAHLLSCVTISTSGAAPVCYEELCKSVRLSCNGKVMVYKYAMWHTFK